MFLFWRFFLFSLLILFSSLSSATDLTSNSEKSETFSPSEVLIAPVKNEIQPGTVAFIRRILGEAKDSQTDLIVLNLDTPGGRLDSALEIKNLLMDSPIPIWVVVNRNALSAGALIALSANRIYMIEGSVIGAATPVLGEGSDAPEKIVSAVRSSMAAAAERSGRDPKIAKAMVDESIVIEGVTEAGKLLTLTAKEALSLNISDGSFSRFEEFKKEMLEGASSIEEIRPAVAENLVRILTHPAVVSILLALAFWGLISEVKTAGWGIGGTLALGALALFFWSHHLAGLAGIEGLILVVLGILLLAIEVFVIPGFGVAGLLGLTAIIGGFMLTILGDVGLARPEDWLRASLIIVAASVFAIIGILILAKYLPGSQFLQKRGLVLGSKMEANRLDTVQESAFDPKAGMIGKALTDLRPAGIAEFEGQRVDVVSQGDYVATGDAVTIHSTFGTRIVVKKYEG